METGTVYFAAAWGEACGYTPAPKKATNLLALHATLGVQFGTKFFAATALTHCQSRHFKSLLAMRHV